MTTTTIEEPDEIEHEEEVEQLESETIETVMEEVHEHEEEEVEEHYEIGISDDSDCEDKEYIGGCLALTSDRAMLR